MTGPDVRTAAGATVVISPYNVADHPQVGGHFWAYAQYAHGLRQLGFEVFWLEHLTGTGDERRDLERASLLERRLERWGLGGRMLLYRTAPDGEPYGYLGAPAPNAEAIFRRADLLLNFHYEATPALLARFARTALVDIDPGLLQFWISRGQVTVAPHDAYFTIGEHIDTTHLRNGRSISWMPTRPAVCLQLWPYVYEPAAESFTTVSGWCGREWVAEDAGHYYENNKRISFLQFVELPRLTPQPLELALDLGDEALRPGERRPERDLESQRDAAHVPAWRGGDVVDREVLERNGWRLRFARDVAGSPESYQRYIQASRGEFGCAKPSYVRLRNAWVSDRTLCYLASGKPAVVQDTGPSDYLESGEGLLRFSTLDGAADALSRVGSAYPRHCRAARALAEAFFDSTAVCESITRRAFTPD